MTWTNHTFDTTAELTEWANENGIKFNRDDSYVVQDTLGRWHLFHDN